LSKWKILTKRSWHDIIGKKEDNGYYEKIVQILKEKNATKKYQYYIPTKKEWLDYLYKLDRGNIKYLVLENHGITMRPFYWQGDSYKVTEFKDSIWITGVGN